MKKLHVCLLVLNMCLLVLAYTNYATRDGNARREPIEPIAYGASISTQNLERLAKAAGREFDTVFVAFFDPARWSPRMDYLGILADLYSDAGLAVVAVSHRGEKRIREHLEKMKSHLRYLSDNPSGLYRDAQIEPYSAQGGFLVLNQSGTVLFSSLGIPEEDQLRQLAEKHVLGVIDYSYRRDKLLDAFAEGEDLPILEVRSLEGEGDFQIKKEQVANSALVVFSSGCATCQLDQHLNRLGSFQEAWAKSGKQKESIRVVFAPHFEPALVISNQRLSKLPSATYILSPGSDLIDRSVTRYENHFQKPRVVVVGSDGKATLVQPLSTAADHIARGLE